MNKSLIARAFTRSASTYDASADVQRRIANSLSKVLVQYADTHCRVFEVGCGTGLLTRRIADLLKPSALVANDISEAVLAMAGEWADEVVAGDAEVIDWPAEVDVVASASAVQWFDNPLSFVSKAASSLASGGILAFSTFLSGTFMEMRQLGRNGLSYPSDEEWAAKLESCGFSVLHQNILGIVTYSPSVRDMLQSLRDTGVTSSSERFRPAELAAFMSAYERQFTTPQGVHLTYEVIEVVARKM